MKTTSEKKRLDKISAEIIQIEEKIAENQAKLESLKKEKSELENKEIISLVRSADLSIDDLYELVSVMRADNKQNGDNDKPLSATGITQNKNNVLKGDNN